jgi:sugar phosphate permease
VILAAGTLAQSSFAALSVGLPALAPALRSHYRLTLGQTGVVLGAVGIGMLLTLLGWGLLADRLSERAVIAFGLAVAGAAIVAAGRTHAYGPLVVALVLAGAFGASVNAASSRAVMGWFPVHERGLALGVRQTAIPIGGAAAAAGLSWLASDGGTRLAFLVLGCGCLAGAAVAAVFIREGQSPLGSSDGVRGALGDRHAWLLGVGTGLYLTAQIAITGYLVLFLHEHRGVSTRAAAGILAGVNILGIGARVASGRWSDAVQKRLAPIRRIGVVLTAATAAVAVLVDAPLAVLIPALVLAGMLSMAWNGLAIVAAAESARAGRVGAAIGLQQTLLGLIVAAVPPGFALVAGSSWRLAFALAALGPLLGIATLRGVPEPRS